MLSANRPFFKLSIVTAALLGLAALPPAAVAQHEHDNPTGYPLDWSNSHVKFRPAGNLQDQKNFEKDPRYLRHRDEERRKWEKLADDDASRRGRDHGKKKGKGDPLTVDWAVSLGNGALAQDMSPALFSTTSSTTPACTDMVVYGMNVAGAVAVPGAGQANLIGVNNLYGTGNGCTTNPNVAFAYALTTGTIATSPVASYFDNGAQIAFVSNESGKATLRVVKYNTGASDGTAAAAPVGYPGTGTEVHLQFSTTTDTNSPLYVDYYADTAYVGDDGGNLYKITPVFGGGTPVATNSATLTGKLTGPILDSANGVVLVGSSNGTLYARKSSDLTAIGGTASLAVGDGSASGGIVDPAVIVEKGVGLATDIFLTTGCDATASHFGWLYEASDTISGLTSLAQATIGEAHNSCPTNKIHAPALDDNSYSGVNGFIYVCGTSIVTTGGSGGTEIPMVYSFSYPTSGTISTTITGTLNPVLNAASECAPITYFTSNSTSKIFTGIGYNNATAGSAVIESNTVTAAGAIGAATQVTTPSSAAAGLGGTSGILVDNASATAGLANVYFTALTAGNVTGGNCQSFTVSGNSLTANTVTLTGSSLNFTAGSTVVVSGFTGSQAAFNGTWALASANTTTLTYTVTGIGSFAAQAGGTAKWGTCAFQLTQSGLN